MKEIFFHNNPLFEWFGCVFFKPPTPYLPNHRTFIILNGMRGVINFKKKVIWIKNTVLLKKSVEIVNVF